MLLSTLHSCQSSKKWLLQQSPNPSKVTRSPILGTGANFLPFNFSWAVSSWDRKRRTGENRDRVLLQNFPFEQFIGYIADIRTWI